MIRAIMSFFFSNALNKVQNKLIGLALEEPKPRISIFPYLSGDAFFAMADVAIMHHASSPVVLRNKEDIIFVEVDLLEKPEVLEYSSRFQVVIAHNGDHELSHSAIETMNSSGIKLFATNVKSKLPDVYTIPIGIENAHHRRNGSIHYFNPVQMSALSSKKERDLLVSFNVTTNPEVRGPLVSELHEAGFANEKMSISEYRSKLANARYVVSPPGNGIDCHRTWEAFYHKTVPVVEKKHWYFENHNLPVLIVNEFQDFIKLTDSEKNDLYQDIIENKYYDAIYFDYWLRFIYEKTYLVD